VLLDGIFTTKVLDYAITDITNSQNGADFTSTITCERRSDWIIPTEILICFQDGTQQTIQWNGAETRRTIELHGRSPVIMAIIDPEKKLLLDINLNNNSYSITPDYNVFLKYFLKFIFWFQTAMQHLIFF
jgi:hypothetical protein